MSHSLRTRAAVAVFAGVAATALAACGSNSNASSGSSSGHDDHSMNTSATAPGGSGQQAQPGKVEVKLTEYSIGLPTMNFAPGTYTFDVSNDGKATHALTINGPGVTNQSSKMLAPGQKDTMTVTLKEGQYEIRCPVGQHKSIGMDMKITVGNAAMSATSGSTAGSGSGTY